MIPLQREKQKRPKYVQFADWVREQVQSGQLRPDQQLLSYAEIEAQLGFSQNTVERAYAILEEEDLIYRVHGRGVFVKAPAEMAAKSDSGFIGYIDKEFQRSKSFLYYTLLMQGAQRAAESVGKQLVVIGSVENFYRWDQLEGVVLCLAGHDPSFSGEAVRGAIPSDLAVVNSMLPDPMIPSIVADDADGIHQAVRHLIGLGHRRIAYLSQIDYEPARQHPLVKLRYEAYLAALHQNNLSPQAGWVYSHHPSESLDYYDYGYQGMTHWLHNGWRETGCTALLAHNDFTALGAIDALRENGLSVPDDVSVVGFDGVEVLRTMPYQLTTIQIPLQEIGAATVQVLLEHMQNPLRTHKLTKLPVQLIVGQTTAPARDVSTTENSPHNGETETATQETKLTATALHANAAAA